jgi:hypothetical protein
MNSPHKPAGMCVRAASPERYAFRKGDGALGNQPTVNDKPVRKESNCRGDGSGNNPSMVHWDISRSTKLWSILTAPGQPLW